MITLASPTENIRHGEIDAAKASPTVPVMLLASYQLITVPMMMWMMEVTKMPTAIFDPGLVDGPRHGLCSSFQSRFRESYGFQPIKRVRPAVSVVPF